MGTKISNYFFYLNTPVLLPAFLLYMLVCRLLLMDACQAVT